MTNRTELLRSLAAAAAPGAVELRRRLHRHPELGQTEFATTAAVADALGAAGLRPRPREAATGLWVDIGSHGPRVAFRADLDGLPIQERTDLEFASEVPGVMHACGHDAHTAIATGIAIVLAQLEELPGSVRILFQPAEELIPGGAVGIIADGLLDGVRAILAFHVDPMLEPGRIGLRTGAITGASDRIVIDLSGPGGHTSRPHRTVDLVYAAGRIITELPTLLQRSTDPRQPVVLAFGRIAGGQADNVIPSEVLVGGTLRVFDPELWRTLPARVRKIVDELVEPLGAVAKLEYEQGSPPVVNDRRVIDAVAAAATAALGSDGLAPTEQSMGSEDFSWYLERTPGALVRLGTALHGRNLDLHAANFDIDERAIETGILVGSMALLELLERI